MQKPALYKTRVATVFGAGRHWLDCIRAGTYARAIGGPVAMTTAAQDKRELLRQWRRENCEPLFVRSPVGWQSRAKTPSASSSYVFISRLDQAPKGRMWRGEWRGRKVRQDWIAGVIMPGKGGVGLRPERPGEGGAAEPVTSKYSINSPCIHYKASEILFIFRCFWTQNMHWNCGGNINGSSNGQAAGQWRASDASLPRGMQTAPLFYKIMTIGQFRHVNEEFMLAPRTERDIRQLVKNQTETIAK